MSAFEQKWRERFENFGKGYQEDHLVSGWSAQGLHQRVELLKELLGGIKQNSFSSVLDLGCGPGTYVRFLSERNEKVVGMDFSMPSLQKAAAKDTQKAGLYVGGDAYCLPFKNEAFDLVISIGTFQTMENPERALAEIHRVLRWRGMLVIEFLNLFGFVNFPKTIIAKLLGKPPRVRSYSPIEINQLLLANQINPILRKGVFLLPRNLPLLNQFFATRPWQWMLEKSSLFSSHAFLLLGEKNK